MAFMMINQTSPGFVLNVEQSYIRTDFALPALDIYLWAVNIVW